LLCLQGQAWLQHEQQLQQVHLQLRHPAIAHCHQQQA
jgi:hypothetical protein